MNSFELFLLLTLCASFVVGPWIGYRAGRHVAKPELDIAMLAGLRAGYRQGYHAGRRDERREAERRVDNITREMPVVSVTVNGDEVDLSPKRAVDVSRPE